MLSKENWSLLVYFCSGDNFFFCPDDKFIGKASFFFFLSSVIPVSEVDYTYCSPKTKGCGKLLTEHNVTFLAIPSFLTSFLMKLPCNRDSRTRAVNVFYQLQFIVQHINLSPCLLPFILLCQTISCGSSVSSSHIYCIKLR